MWCKLRCGLQGYVTRTINFLEGVMVVGEIDVQIRSGEEGSRPRTLR
jgi:hypothetical protein